VNIGLIRFLQLDFKARAIPEPNITPQKHEKFSGTERVSKEKAKYD
jgi:hypothetical protein